MTLEQLQAERADAAAQRDSAHPALTDAQATIYQCTGALIVLDKLIAAEQAATPTEG